MPCPPWAAMSCSPSSSYAGLACCTPRGFEPSVPAWGPTGEVSWARVGGGMATEGGVRSETGARVHSRDSRSKGRDVKRRAEIKVDREPDDGRAGCGTRKRPFKLVRLGVRRQGAVEGRREARPQEPTLAALHRIWRAPGEHHGGHGEVSPPARPSCRVRLCQLCAA